MIKLGKASTETKAIEPRVFDKIDPPPYVAPKMYPQGTIL